MAYSEDGEAYCIKMKKKSDEVMDVNRAATPMYEPEVPKYNLTNDTTYNEINSQKRKDQLIKFVDEFKVALNGRRVNCHSNRKSGIQFIVSKGAPYDQLRQVGRWSSDRMVSCYLVYLPVKALKALANFSAEREDNYFISCAIIDSPYALQNKVFPQIEIWKDRFQNKDNIEEDSSARNFLEPLEYLRIVFLQDSIALKQKYPDHYLWKNEIFDTPEYLLFEQQLSTVINRNEVQINMAQHLDVLVPELTSVMREASEVLNTSIAAIQA